MQQYFILRDDKEYGPYTLDYLKRYVEKGNIRPEDWARVDGVEGKFYVSELLSGRAVNGAPLDPIVAPPALTALREAPQPPNVHWGVWLCIYLANAILFGYLGRIHPGNAVVQVLSEIIPCAFIGWQVLWAKRADVKSRAFIYFPAYVVTAIAAVLIFASLVITNSALPPAQRAALMMEHMGSLMLGWTLSLASVVFYIVTAFSLRSSVELCYRECEGMERPLSGVMTFFFSTFYIQYHFNEISQRMAARRKAGGDLFTGV